MSTRIPTRWVLTLAAVIALLTGGAPHASAQSKGLARSYSYTVGDDIALRMAGFFQVVAGLEASTLVYYDRKEHTLVADVVGSSAEPEGAERELEAFLAAFREFIAPYAKRQHGLQLTDRDVTLIYWNDGGEGSAPYEVVRRERGRYKVPPPPADDQE